MTLGIIILMLTQILLGFQLASTSHTLDPQGAKEGHAVTEIPVAEKIGKAGPESDIQKGTDVEEFRGPTRSSELENDDFGGSWYDELEDNGSVEYSANVSVENGMTIIAENEIIPDRNCSGLWHLNEENGITALDGSGNGYNGTVIGGANWTAGKFGASLLFDGIDDYVDVENSSSLDVSLNDSFTVTAWINTSNSTNQSIVARGWFGATTHGYAIVMDEENPHKVTVLVGDNATESRIESTTSVDDGKWHHIGLVRDTLADKIILYVDGIQEGNITDNTTDNISITDSLYLGSSWNGTSFTDWFEGRIDEVAVWNRTLSSGEIGNQMNSYRNSGNIRSTLISLPEDMKWSFLSLEKSEPTDMYVNISVENEFNAIIIGYQALTGTNIDLTDLNGEVDKIRLKAVLSGNGNDTPGLLSWGVEWMKENTWRDSFIEDGNIDESTNVVISGNIEIDNLTLPASVISRPIELPEGNFWHTLRINCSVPAQNFINITLHDNTTDEVLIMRTASGSNEAIYIGDIHPAGHGRIYLKASFSSDGLISPVLYDWGVNWTPSGGIAPPQLIGDFPSIINVTEDSPEENIIDLSEYFFDTYAGIWPPVYAIETISDITNISVGLNGSKLDLRGLLDNWTGTVEIMVNCTNSFGLSISSGPFNITVINVDDGPVWSGILPTLSLAEDNMHTTDFALDDYLFDAEGDALELILTLADDNISATVDNDTRITITPSKDYNGKTDINIFARQLNDQSMKTGIITVPVTVVPVNDLPYVESPHPKDGSIARDVNVNFSWSPRDIDNNPSELSYDFYLGETQPPALHSRDIKLNYIIIKGLEDSTHYYWYVKPFDGELFGVTPGNFWSFTVDTDVSIPEVTLQTPLNGTTLNKMEVNLTWISENTGEDATYHIYLGGGVDTIIKVATTRNTWYSLTGLDDNKTYYWMVIPTTPTLEGICKNGVWKFEINVSFEPIYEIDIEILGNVKELNVTYGVPANFNISIENTGNVPISVSFSYAGLPNDILVWKTHVVARVNVTEINKVTVHIPLDVDPGNYTLSITGDYKIGIITLDLPITVYKISIEPSPPQARIIISPKEAEPGELIRFDASSSVKGDGTIISYRWDFDAGFDSDGDRDKTNDEDADTQIAYWNYSKEKTYTVTLTVTDSNNQTHTATMNITVEYPSNTQTLICSVSIVVALVLAGAIFLSRLGKREALRRAESLDRKRHKLYGKKQRKSESEGEEKSTVGTGSDAEEGK